MKSAYTRHGEINTLESILNEVREQGDKDLPKPVFNAIFCVVALCLVLMIVLLSRIGLDLIEAYLPTGAYFVGLLLLCSLIVWSVKYFVKVWLFLWSLTKED